MANHPSAKKRNRQTVTRTTVNRARITRIKSLIKKIEAAIIAGDMPAAKKALQEAQPKLMSGVSKGVIKKGTATRKMSRLSARVKKIPT